MDNKINPKISIIILNWNGLENTVECLESLKKITYPNYEVIVVDNGSKENDVDVLKEEYRDYIKLIRNKENLGFADGNNVGILEVLKNKEVEYIFCLNNDIVVEPDVLDKLLKVAEDKKFKDFGSFQPKMVWYYHRDLMDSAGLLYSKNSLGFNRGGFESVEKYNELKEIFGCCGGAAFYRRKVVEELVKEDKEFFDSDFFAYYEDCDVSFRLLWRGWKCCFVPEAVVYHKRGGDTESISEFSSYLRHRNNLYVVFKNLPKSFIIKNFLIIFLAQIISIIINFIRRGTFGFKVLKAKINAFRNYRAMKQKAVII